MNQGSGGDRNSNDSQPLVTIGKTRIFEKEIDTNLAITACYVPLPPLNIVASILILVGQSDNAKLTKFHAIQALLFSGAMLVLGGIINTVAFIGGSIPLLGVMLGIGMGIVGIIIYFAYLAYSFRLVYNSFRGKDVKVPFLSSIAETFVDPK